MIFPLENPAEEVLQVLAVHFRRLLHSPGIFLQKQKILPDFQKDKFSLFLHAPLQNVPIVRSVRRTGSLS